MISVPLLDPNHPTGQKNGHATRLHLVSDLLSPLVDQIWYVLCSLVGPLRPPVLEGEAISSQASQRTFAVSTSKIHRAVGTYQAEVLRDRMFRIMSMYLQALKMLHKMYKWVHSSGSIPWMPVVHHNDFVNAGSLQGEGSSWVQELVIPGFHWSPNATVAQKYQSGWEKHWVAVPRADRQ